MPLQPEHDGEELQPKDAEALLHAALNPPSLPDSEKTAAGEISIPSTPFTATRLRYFGDYEILQEVARGGMGIVFKAKQLNLNRFVALKLVHAGALASEDLVKRFKAEAEAAAALSHPNIVPIYEIGEVHGQHYFSMSLIEGVNLDKHLSGRGQPPESLAGGREDEAANEKKEAGLFNYGEPKRAAWLGLILARAVAHAHQHGVLHRDIKPSNILIDQNGTPYLTDFGLAKFAERDSTLTQTNVILGTPSYMAPEQARGETRHVTTAADIYGLGAVLYACLTGHPPFAGGTTFETIRQVLEEEPRPPSEWNSAVDPDLQIICLKCLSKDPARRYRSAEHLAGDLEHWLNGEPIEARPSTTYERLQKWVRRRPAVAGLIAALGLLLLVLGIGGTFYSVRLAKAGLTLEENLYAAEMGVAFAEWNRGNMMLPRQILETNWPGRRQARDLRGFEWHYLDALCQPKELFTLPKQAHQIFGMACSPDGRLIAAAQMNKTIRLIDLVARRDVGLLEGPEAGYSVAFDVSGQRLLSSTFVQGILPVWDVGLKRVITNLPVGGVVLSAAFSPDPQSKLIVSSTGELYDPATPGEVVLWSGITYEKLHVFPVQPAACWETRFSPDGRLLAAARGDGKIVIWELAATNLLREIDAHAGIVSALAFSPDGNFLASGSMDETVSLWTIPDFRPLPVGRHERVDSVVFSRDGKWLASSARDQTIKVWNLKNRRAKPILLRGHSGRIWTVDSTPDGHRLISASADGTIKVWDWKSVTQEAPSPAETRLSTDFTPDAKLNLREEGTNTVIVAVPSEAAVATLPITGTACSPDNRCVIGLAGTHELSIFDRPSFKIVKRIRTEYPLLNLARFSADGRKLATFREARACEIREPARNWQATTVWTVAAAPSDAAFSSDGKFLAVASITEKAIAVYDVNRTRPVEQRSHRFNPPGLYWSPAWLPKTHILAVPCDEPFIYLWDIDAGSLQVVHLGAGMAWALAAAPDGRTLAVGTQDGFLQLINLKTLRVMTTLRGHITNITRLGFSPDGLMLISSGSEGSRLWRALPGGPGEARDLFAE